MSGSEFWKGSDQGEPEAWKQSGHAGSTGNSTRNYEDYLRKLYAEVDRHLKKLREQSQDENQSRTRHSHANSALEGSENRETPLDSTGGNPYHEEKMKIPSTRRGGQKRLKNPFANGSSSSFSGGTNITPYSKSVDCPESGCEVCFSDCLRCENFQQWDERDDLRRCYHEYMDLDSRGYYDGTWDDHPENFDPETFERIQERKQRNEDFEREMELEREDEEFERRAKEMERKADSEYEEYLKDKYGDQEDEGDHEDEEREKDEDEDDYDEETEDDEDEDDVEDDYDEEDDEDEFGEEDYFGDDQDDGYDYGDGWRG